MNLSVHITEVHYQDGGHVFSTKLNSGNQDSLFLVDYTPQYIEFGLKSVEGSLICWLLKSCILIRK